MFIQSSAILTEENISTNTYLYKNMINNYQGSNEILQIQKKTCWQMNRYLQFIWGNVAKNTKYKKNKKICIIVLPRVACN